MTDMAAWSNKLLILVTVITTILTGCLWRDESYENKHLSKNFWLNWWGEPGNRQISHSTDSKGRNGTAVVEETVFAVGFDENFIIAKQHPNLHKQIQQRLFNYDKSEGAYWLSDPNDTVYLARQDSFYFKNGKYYHVSNGWNPPDSLKPHRKVTNYFIIDVRNYSEPNIMTSKTYRFDTEIEFLKKRKELNVPEQLQFAMVDSTLQ